MRDSNPRPSAWEADVLPGWTNAAQVALQLLEIKDLPAMECIFTHIFLASSSFSFLYRVLFVNFRGAGLLAALVLDN